MLPRTYFHIIFPEPYLVSCLLCSSDTLLIPFPLIVHLSLPLLLSFLCPDADSSHVSMKQMPLAFNLGQRGVIHILDAFMLGRHVLFFLIMTLWLPAAPYDSLHVIPNASLWLCVISCGVLWFPYAIHGLL